MPDMLSIAAVERDTGIAKDTLRVWERRYNFPMPLRDKNDDRVYPADQIEKLRILKRLLDSGFRPGRIVPLPIEALKELSARSNQAAETNTHIFARADTTPPRQTSKSKRRSQDSRLQSLHR